MRTINDWEPETRSLLDDLLAAGFTILKGYNGEEEFRFDGNLTHFIEDLTACDEAHLWVYHRGTKKELWMYLVLGNEPGVLVSDYTCHEELDKLTEAHFEKWDGKEQPTKQVL